MAGNFNKVFLMGNLTRDIELRHIGGDQAVAKIGIAVNRRFRTKDGENREEATFVDCEAWGRTAETMSKYLSKGSPVFLEGRLKLDQWQDKDGGNRSKLKVVVENFQFVDSPRDSGGRPSGGAGGGRSHAAAHADSGPGYEPLDESDIPF